MLTGGKNICQDKDFTFSDRIPDRDVTSGFWYEFEPFRGSEPFSVPTYVSAYHVATAITAIEREIELGKVIIPR